MKFKSKKLKKDWWKIHPKLRMLLCHLDYFFLTGLKEEILITSLIRPKRKDSGIHAQGRACDIRMNWMYAKELSDLRVIMNYLYPYDEKRPNMQTMIFHDGQYGYSKPAYHYHIQVMS